eukprot:7716570-Pyramimonas_sp.AAC.2
MVTIGNFEIRLTIGSLMGVRITRTERPCLGLPQELEVERHSGSTTSAHPINPHLQRLPLSTDAR